MLIEYKEQNIFMLHTNFLKIYLQNKYLHKYTLSTIFLGLKNL